MTEEGWLRVLSWGWWARQCMQQRNIQTFARYLQLWDSSVLLAEDRFCVELLFDD